MLQAVGDESRQQAYRSTLKAFYGALKSQDGNIKFALLTGVTKFGKVSVFSDLNNLEDISRNKYYADICGISEEELLKNFSDDIQELASAMISRNLPLPTARALTRPVNSLGRTMTGITSVPVA